jgi:hypothetical protein
VSDEWLEIILMALALPASFALCWVIMRIDNTVKEFRAMRAFIREQERQQRLRDEAEGKIPLYNVRTDGWR